MTELTEPGAQNEPSVEKYAAMVSAAWTEVLGYETSDQDAGFFDAGGDSLLLLALVARLSEASGMQLKTLKVYQAATIRGQARLLQSMRRDQPGA